MKQVIRGRPSGFEVFLLMDVHIFSKGGQPVPMIPESIISTFEGEYEVLRGSQTSKKISTIIKGKKVCVPPVSRRQACNALDLLFEVMVVALSSGDLKGFQLLNQIDWRPRCNYLLGGSAARMDHSMAPLQLDHQVLGSY